jgi:hypothetical protein
MGNVPGELIPIVAIIGASAVAIFVPMARAYARRMEREGSSALANPDVVARLERMEQAIESIAVEIERVSEGQRFTTKLLSEQKSPRIDAGTNAEPHP